YILKRCCPHSKPERPYETPHQNIIVERRSPPFPWQRGRRPAAGAGDAVLLPTVRVVGDDEGSCAGRLPEPRPFCGGVSFGAGLHAPSIPGPVPVAPRPAADRLGGPPTVLGRDRVGGRVRRPSAPDAPFPARLRPEPRPVAATNFVQNGLPLSRFC